MFQSIEQRERKYKKIGKLQQNNSITCADQRSGESVEAKIFYKHDPKG